jgi:DNA-3-methyladenine glycosylase II
MPTLQQAADYLAAKDSTLASIITAFGLPSFEAHANYYQALCSSIISQQLSVKAAATIEKRFVDLFDDQFPSPDDILRRSVEELRGVGLSRPKANYIQDLARRILDGTVKFDALDTLTNEEIVVELTKVKGIGEWTVHMFLMFCMGRLDVLPVGDLGIRNGIKQLYLLDHVPSPEEVFRVASENHWHPYESIASWYVWQSLKVIPEILI